MKKYILIILALIALCACDPKTQTDPLYEGNGWDYPDKQLRYRGHVYYIWYEDRGIAVVHDPDCSCYKKKQH